MSSQFSESVQSNEENTLLALASGGSILAKDVEIGTQLAGQDGAIVTVQCVTPRQVHQLYRITTTTTGSYDVTANHLITVRWAKNSTTSTTTTSTSGVSVLHPVKRLEAGDLFEVPASDLFTTYWNQWQLPNQQTNDSDDSDDSDDSHAAFVNSALTILPQPVPVDVSSHTSDSMRFSLIDPIHMDLFTKAVQEANHSESVQSNEKMLEQFIFRVVGNDEYESDVIGTKCVSAVYQLLNPLIGDDDTQSLTSAGEKPYTFLRLDNMWKLIGVDTAVDNIALTELKPIAGSTGMMKSVIRAYNTVCVDTIKSVLTLRTPFIVAFGQHTCECWSTLSLDDVSALGFTQPIEKIVRVGSYSVRYLSLQALDASADDDEVKVYLAPHPSNWRQQGLLATTLAVAHGISLNNISSVVEKCVDAVKIDRFRSIEQLNGEARVIDLQVDGNHRYAFANSILTHNCVQTVLDVAPPGVRTNIKVKMEGKYMRLSKQKFSSNVVEKCLKSSSSHWRTIIIRELIAQPAVSELLRDRYGNYVLQTALAVANAQQVQEILRSITPYLPSLRDNVRSKWKKMLVSSLVQLHHAYFQCYVFAQLLATLGDSC